MPSNIFPYIVPQNSIVVANTSGTHAKSFRTPCVMFRTNCLFFIPLWLLC